MVRVVRKKREFQRYLKSETVRKLLQDQADEIAVSAGSGYEASVWDAPTRLVGNVRAESIRAMRDNARNNTLVRVVARHAKR